MPGIVYLLTNEAMPGLIKIGRTEQNDPRGRMSQLYNTSVPVPFECVLAKRVDDPQVIESNLHKIFDPDRVNPRREFFRITTERAVAALGLVTDGEDVTSDFNEVDGEISESERSSSNRLRRRRPNLNFEEMGIPRDSTLEYVRPNSTDPIGEDKAVVIDEKRVRFRDETMSLTEATRKATDFVNVAPTPYWSYRGRNLREIYNETYPLDTDSG